jgi:hypothetical protein
MVPSEEPSGPYLEAIQRAFQFARELGRGCGPAEFLVGISEGHGPAAAALDPGQGRSLRAVAAAADGTARPGAMYLHMQAQSAAQSLAAALGQPAGAEHLLIALLDQGTPEVTQTMGRAGLDAAAVRQATLAVIGAAADQPPIPLPALAPAGTMDRPPLPFADLDARAWAALRWRQDHLPLSRLRRDTDWQALTHLERTAAWRLTARLGLDDDQRYSLICHHSDQVERRAAQGRPDLARRRIPGRAAAAMAIARGRRRHRFLAFTVGWATWFDNRRVGLRDRWFRLRTIRYYRGSPQI